MVFRGEPQPLPSSVADALRVAADHMEESGDDRSRLLRELANGFACSGGRTDQWEVTVTKFHTRMVTNLCNAISDDIVHGLAETIRERIDEPVNRWFVRRETGATRTAKAHFIYRFEVFVTTHDRPAVTALFDELGEEAAGLFIDQSINVQVEPSVRNHLTCLFEAKAVSPAKLQRSPGYSVGSVGDFYFAHLCWELKFPKEAIVEHFGFSLRDI